MKQQEYRLENNRHDLILELMGWQLASKVRDDWGQNLSILDLLRSHPNIDYDEQGGACRGQGLISQYLGDEEVVYVTWSDDPIVIATMTQTPRPCGHIEILLLDPRTAPIVKLMPEFYQEAIRKHLLPLNGAMGTMEHAQRQYDMRFIMQRPEHLNVRPLVHKMIQFKYRTDPRLGKYVEKVPFVSEHFDYDTPDWPFLMYSAP